MIRPPSRLNGKLSPASSVNGSRIRVPLTAITAAQNPSALARRRALPRAELRSYFRTGSFNSGGYWVWSSGACALWDR